MDMQSFAWWPVLILLVTATVVDIRCRRVPNWLVLPFLVAGITVNTVIHGWKGAGNSLEGITFAATITGILCWLGGMGLGDLKLCAAVGAWIGPGQLGIAMVVTGLAGGVLGLTWAVFYGTLSESLDRSSDLISNFLIRGIQNHPSMIRDHSSARTMPYAPAIAIGTIFSFFAN